MRVFVGSTLQQWAREFDATLEDRKFGIVFVGTYIPLHGIETILKAAEKLLPRSDIEFTLVGGGQLKDEMKSYALSHHLDNVKFIDWIDTEDLPGFMQEFDLALGVFGSTEKTQRVIATKIFDSDIPAKIFAIVWVENMAGRTIVNPDFIRFLML